MTVSVTLVRAGGLVKRFGERTAVAGVDLAVRRGEAFGCLGPNGAGKTSLMRMIGCVSPLSGGELTVLGLDTRTRGRAIRARLGVCPQEDGLDPELTAWENLYVHARYYRIPRATARRRAAELLGFVQLDERANSPVAALSGGMKRRLTFARALVNEPDLLLLDEPTTGLDPQARHLFWDRLRQLKQRGTTLILTTHYLEEAERLCDRLVILERGRIIAEGSPSAMIRRHATRDVVELRFDAGALDAYADKLDGIGHRAEVLPGRILLYADDGDAAAAAVSARRLCPAGVVVRRASLEDVYLRLTGRELGEQ